MLRARAAREANATSRFTRRVEGENAAFLEARGKSESTNSHSVQTYQEARVHDAKRSTSENRG
ncbi:hypothetical protein [Ruegeria sediminis]|uniref:hypothetical protein n=1 Tax=Ruegeria sediminis TaxID=2583820 RepID=UPI001486CFFC|nr:hypothetical protein [Ruegeria sediminis]